MTTSDYISFAFGLIALGGGFGTWLFNIGGKVKSLGDSVEYLKRTKENMLEQIKANEAKDAERDLKIVKMESQLERIPNDIKEIKESINQILSYIQNDKK